ncbi:MAG TPA: M23 family metallopeptidase [Longimicrobiales bacterium]|nr:M23 family metallopeptidase [Longimicrobiales bacterium]
MTLRRVALSLLLGVGVAGCAIPRWPVDAPMTSSFGFRLRGIRPEIHRGVDLAVPEGTEVRAMAPGRVRFAGVQQGFGNVVWVDHGGQVITVYAHLSTIRVRTGDEVKGRAVLGLSGSSGEARGAHLHFEIWRWGREVDPVPLLGGRPRS